MNKENLIIAVHTSKPEDEEANALVDAFCANGVRAMTYENCMLQNLTPHIAIGFDSAGLPHWQKILNSGIINIIWSKDSVFSKNINIIEQFASYQNFVVLTPTPCDIEAVSTFFPQLKHGYLPLGYPGTSNEPVHKEYDFALIGNIVDIEKKWAELKAQMPEFVYNLMSDIFTISMENPNLSFWQIYNLFCENIGLEKDLDQYYLLFSNIAHLVTSQKMVQIAEKMQKLNVKVFGNDIWKKYVKGKVEYCGQETQTSAAKANILINPHPIELSLGINENILKAASAKTFILSSNTGSIELEFENNAGYFDYSKLNDVEKKAKHFLENEKERLTKAEKAYEILNNSHTLNKRTAEIIKIIN